MSKTKGSATAAWIVLLSASVFAQKTERQPSTREDRIAASAMAKILETDPLNRSAKESRRWFLKWISAVPDIKVSMCAKLLAFPPSDRGEFAPEIQFQQVMSSTAFMIDNPAMAADDVAVYTAGVEGSLKAYQAILKMTPSARRQFLDDLVVVQAKGHADLAAVVQDRLKECSIKH